MKVFIFDLRDSKNPCDRLIVLRLVDDTGCLRVQSPIYNATEDTARNLGDLIASAFNTQLQWVGPSPIADAIATVAEAQRLEATKLETQLQAAIDRSISHDEIVRVTIEGDSGDALEALGTIWDGEIDYTMIDAEGVDTLDVWGWTDATPADEQDWRLAIRFED
jgi:hypothetical protein